MNFEVSEKEQYRLGYDDAKKGKVMGDSLQFSITPSYRRGWLQYKYPTTIFGSIVSYFKRFIK